MVKSSKKIILIFLSLVQGTLWAESDYRVTIGPEVRRDKNLHDITKELLNDVAETYKKLGTASDIDQFYKPKASSPGIGDLIRNGANINNESRYYLAIFEGKNRGKCGLYRERQAIVEPWERKSEFERLEKDLSKCYVDIGTFTSFYMENPEKVDSEFLVFQKPAVSKRFTTNWKNPFASRVRDKESIPVFKRVFEKHLEQNYLLLKYVESFLRDAAKKKLIEAGYDSVYVEKKLLELEERFLLPIREKVPLNYQRLVSQVSGFEIYQTMYFETNSEVFYWQNASAPKSRLFVIKFLSPTPEFQTYVGQTSLIDDDIVTNANKWVEDLK